MSFNTFTNHISKVLIKRNSIKLWLGPLVSILILLFADLIPGKPEVTRMAAIAFLMAYWWLSEAVHHAVTALIPIIFIPLLGIDTIKVTAMQYMDPIIFLFIGGFILAFAIEKWNLHQRVALKILMKLGTSPSMILLGVMITSFFISIWISNTSTVMMLLAAVLALIHQVNHHLKEEEHRKKFSSALLIGLAYSATIGGMATLVGTPTNMIFYREYTNKFPQNTDMNFFEWFKIGFPLALLFLAACFWVLRSVFIKKEMNIKLQKNYFSNEYHKLGKTSFEEKIVGIVFVITAVLWFSREKIDFGGFIFPGWSTLIPWKEFISDSTIAVGMAFLLFFIPSKKEKGKHLIEWDDLSRLPFDIILLFGGGFALAKGFEVSGLSNWIAAKLHFATAYSPVVFILVMCILVCIISEFASNVACIQLMIPILIAIQKDMNVSPLFLLFPATMASSLGFMLPVATAPNTIVFGTKKVRTREMLRAGIWMDLIGIILVTVASVLLIK